MQQIAMIFRGTKRASRILPGRKLTPPPRELKRAVISLLALLSKQPSFESVRCHERARSIRDGLIRQGYDAVVKDGDVIYQPDFCRRLIARKGENLSKTYFASPKVYHSWCEIGDMRVDFHRNLKMRMAGFLVKETILLIHKIGEFDSLIHYNPCGREFGYGRFRYIYFSDLDTYSLHSRSYLK